MNHKFTIFPSLITDKSLINILITVIVPHQYYLWLILAVVIRFTPNFLFLAEVVNAKAFQIVF